MITPEYLNEIMYAVEDKLVDVDNYILRKIVKRIADTFETDENGELLIPSTKNDIRKLVQSGVLYKDIQREVEKALPDISGAIKDAFYQSAAEINRQNIDIARQIVELEGLNIAVPEPTEEDIPRSASQLNMTKAEIRLLESAYRRTKGEVVNMTHTMPKNAYNNYIQACDNAFMRINSGVSVQTAIVDAIKEVSDKGMEIEYTGRTDRMEVAIARAVRTGINQTNADITLMRCAEMGVSFVKVSAHLGARVTKADDYTSHAKWQGKVYKLNWNAPELKEFAESAKVEEDGFEWLNQMRKAMQEKYQNT